MPFRLNPEQHAYRAEIAERMRAARETLAAANAEAADFADDVASTAQAEIERLSPRWRDTPRGRRVMAWTRRWQEFRPAPHDATAAEALLRLPAAPDQ